MYRIAKNTLTGSLKRYDKEKGFSILDYHTIQNTKYSLADAVSWLRGALGHKNYPDILGKHKYEWQSEAYKREAYPSSLDSLVHSCTTSLRLLKVLKKDFPRLLDELREHIKQLKADPKVSGAEYVNPERIRESYKEYAQYTPNPEGKIEEIERLLSEIDTFNL